MRAHETLQPAGFARYWKNYRCALFGGSNKQAVNTRHPRGDGPIVQAAGTVIEVVRAMTAAPTTMVSTLFGRISTENACSGLIRTICWT